MAKLKLNDVAFSILKKQMEQRAKDIATDARDRLTDEYNRVIDFFYSDYSPNYYQRHSGIPGMRKTFRKYYRNSHGTSYSGGIQIGVNDMYNDYGYKGDNRAYVLDSFLDGYHGPKHLEITGNQGIKAYEHMIKFRDNLVRKYNRK